MHANHRMLLSVLGLTLLSCLPSQATETLYTLDVGGVLFEVDQATGATTEVIADLGPTSWSGLSASVSEDGILYAIQNPRPAVFEDPQFSRLSRIDVANQSAELFPLFDSQILGVAELFAMGIAISPLLPDTAIVVGNDREIPPNPYIWEVNLMDGSVREAARELSGVRRIESLTYSPDGSTLYGTNQDGALITVDVANASVSTVGDPGITNFVTGLAFHPTSGDLFAIDGLSQDRLVTLDATNGAFGESRGSLGIKGPDGLAFLATTSVDPLDCSEDGMVDLLDLDCANETDITSDLLDRLQLLPGDLDGTNGVNFDDFIVLADSFGRPRGKYTEGDINDDGQVAFDDFVIFAANFGRSFPSGAAEAPVPEPSGMPLWGMAMLILGWRRKSASKG